jgi:hypothetical protein
MVDQLRGERATALDEVARLQPTRQTLTSEEAVAVADDIRTVMGTRFGAVSR